VKWRSEVKWSEVKWSEVKWSEVKWSVLTKIKTLLPTPCPVPTVLHCLLTFSFALKPEPQQTGPIGVLKFSRWCNQSLVFWHVTLKSSGMFGTRWPAMLRHFRQIQNHISHSNLPACDAMSIDIKLRTYWMTQLPPYSWSQPSHTRTAGSNFGYNDIAWNGS